MNLFILFLKHFLYFQLKLYLLYLQDSLKFQNVKNNYFKVFFFLMYFLSSKLLVILNLHSSSKLIV